MDNLDYYQRKSIMPNKKYLCGQDVFKKERIEEYRKLGFPLAFKALEDDWNALSNQERAQYYRIFEEANDEYLSDLQEVEKLRYKPKAPLSAEERFFNSVSDQVERDHPDLNEAQRNKIHKKMWDRLDSEERQPFIDEHEKDLIAYNQALKERELKFEQQREKMSKPGNGIYMEERLYGFSEKDREAFIKSRKRELVSLNANDPPKKSGRPAKQEQKEQETEEQPAQEKGLKKREKSQNQKEQKDLNSQTVEQPIKQEKAQKQREKSQKQKKEGQKEKNTVPEEEPANQEKGQKKREKSQKQKQEQKKNEQQEQHSQTEEQPIVQQEKGKKEKSQKQKEQKQQKEEKEKSPLRKDNIQQKKEAPAKRGRSKE